MKILGIIQARMNSTRLPKKVLMKLGEKSVLENVFTRVGRAKQITEVVVATTIGEEDLAIVKLCAEAGQRVFCGSENDVLDRFYQTAKLFSPDHIVRITADCPLMDPEVIDQVISFHLSSKSDYTANCLEETFPDGEDVEVFTFNALKEAWIEAKLASEREHVTPYIRKFPERLKLSNLRSPVNHGGKRWTLDNKEDYEFISSVYKHLSSVPNFGMNDVLKLLEKKPELEALNRHLTRNEGYAKSLKEDKIVNTENK